MSHVGVDVAVNHTEMTDGTLAGVARYIMQRYPNFYFYGQRNTTVKLSYHAATNESVLTMGYQDGPPSYHVLLGQCTWESLFPNLSPHVRHPERDIRDWAVRHSYFPVFHLLPFPPRVQCRVCVGVLG